MTNAWVRERFALTALEYPIRARSNRLDFMLGALTLVALTLLAVTGIVLTQFYDPTPLGAHESLRSVIPSLPLVTFIRDVHVWSATGAIVLVFTHLAAVFWRRGFRRPREGLWWSGVLLLALLLGLALTGTLLKADQEAVEALAHAMAGAKVAGPLGAPFQPNFTPSSPLFTRMYGLHAAVLFGFLALVPVTDRPGARLAAVTRWIGVLLFVLMVVAIIYAAVAPGQAHLNMKM